MLIDYVPADSKERLQKDPQVTLQAIEMSDMPIIVKWRNMPEIYEQFYEYEPLSVHQQTEWFKRLMTNEKEKLWMICNHGRPVGTVGLVNIDWRSKKCEWGRFFIGEKSSRGRGVGLVTERLVISYVFNYMNMNKLYCEVFVSNEKVVRLHKRHGFKEEGVFKEHVFKNGKYQDVVRLALLEKDYRK